MWAAESCDGRGFCLAPHHRLIAIRFGARVGHRVALAVQTSNEHGASVHVAAGLVGGNDGILASFGRDVSNALAEAASAKFFRATEELNEVVGVVGGKAGLHGAEMLIAEWKDVRAHEGQV